MSRKDKIDANIAQYVKAHYNQIDVQPEQGLFNQRCFSNAAEYKRLYGGEIAEVIVCNGDDAPYLHYINVINDVYYETTLGYQAEYLEYYLIRIIPSDRRDYMYAEFTNSLDVWLKQFTTWFDRNILRIDRVL